MRTPLFGLLAVPLLCAVARSMDVPTVAAEDSARRRNSVVEPKVRLPLVFVENRGQFDPAALFRVRVPGMTLDVHGDGWTLHGEKTVRVRFDRGETEGDLVVQGRDRLRATANYFYAERDAEHPTVGIPTFGRVHVAGIRPGMDLELFETAGRLEYDVRLAPGAAVEDVAFTLEGVDGSGIDDDGGLLSIVGGSQLRQRPPVVWQIEADGTRRELVGSFRELGENRYGFRVDGRDPDLALVIDPILVFNEFIGGSNADAAEGVAVGNDGAVYVTGWAKSSDFPGSLGRRSGRDVVVFKLDATGNELAYATFVGGNSDDRGLAIEVNAAGEAFVAGVTRSSDFPVTSRGQQRSRGGNDDGFVLRLSADGSDLAWATFLGGSANDVANGLALGPDDSAYVVGTTRSNDFPVTPYAYQPNRGGGRDAFLARLDSSGQVLVFSTYLGGVRDDEGFDVVLDGNSDPYVAGMTDSGDFPVTLASLKERRTEVDAFVTKFGAGGGSLVYSTFLGGTGRDGATSIDLDEDDQAWVAGWTESTDYPTTRRAMQPTNVGRRDGFLSRLSTSGASLTYSTYVGGAKSDDVTGLALDAYGSAWVVGTSTSDDLPVSPDAAQETRAGGRDAFLIGVDPHTGALDFGSYIGGGGHETALAIATQPMTENLVVVGSAENVDPALRGPLSGRTRGPSDAVVARFEPGMCGSRGELTVLGAGGGVQVEATPPRLGKRFELRVFGGPPNTTGYVLVSRNSAASKLVEGLLEMHLDSDSTRTLYQFTTDDQGEWSLDAVIPRDGRLCGRTMIVQVVTFDKALGPLSFGQLSQGLLLSFGD